MKNQSKKLDLNELGGDAGVCVASSQRSEDSASWMSARRASLKSELNSMIERRCGQPPYASLPAVNGIPDMFVAGVGLWFLRLEMDG